MTVFGRAGVTAALCALAIVSGGVLGQTTMPEEVFVCQVEEADGVTRFIGVQTLTRKAAEDIVEGRSRLQVPAGRKLIECIDPDQETFKSAKAQRDYMEELR